MVALSFAEHRTHITVVQVNDFVDQAGTSIEQQRCQRRITPSWLQVTKMLGGHLPAFAGELQQAILVDCVFQPQREIQLIDGFQAA